MESAYFQVCTYNNFSETVFSHKCFLCYTLNINFIAWVLQLISLPTDYLLFNWLFYPNVIQHKYLFYSVKMAYPPKQILHLPSTQRHNKFFFCSYGHLTSLETWLWEKKKPIRSLLIERSSFKPTDSLRETGRDSHFGFFLPMKANKGFYMLPLFLGASEKETIQNIRENTV